MTSASTLVHTTETPKANGHDRVLDAKTMARIIKGLSNTQPTQAIAKFVAKQAPHARFTATAAARSANVLPVVAGRILHSICRHNPNELSRVMNPDTEQWEFVVPGPVDTQPIPEPVQMRKYVYKDSAAYAFRGYVAAWPVGEERTSGRIYADLSKFTPVALHSAIRNSVNEGHIVNLNPPRGVEANYRRTDVAVRQEDSYTARVPKAKAPAKKTVPAQRHQPEEPQPIQDPSGPLEPNIDTHKMLGILDESEPGTWVRLAQFPEGTIQVEMETLRDKTTIIWAMRG